VKRPRTSSGSSDGTKSWTILSLRLLNGINVLDTLNSEQLPKVTNTSTLTRVSGVTRGDTIEADDTLMNSFFAAEFNLIKAGGCKW